MVGVVAGTRHNVATAEPGTGVGQDGPVTDVGPSPPRVGGWWQRGRLAPPWQVPRGLLVLALPVAVWLVLVSVLLVFREVPDHRLAVRLHESGVAATATAVREEISRRGDRAAAEATFRTAEGEEVVADLAGVDRDLDVYDDGSVLRTTWRPGTDQYAAPLPVVYDPEQPSDVMAAADVERFRDDRAVDRGLTHLAVCAALLLLIAAAWLLTVAGRVLRQR